MKNIEKKYLLHFGFSILLVFLFGFKDIWILLYSKWPHLYAVVNTPRAIWEEIYCYFPFANHFALNKLLPAAPMADPVLNKLTDFPAITLIVQGMIFKWLCFSNINMYLLFMHTVFPILSFWIIFLVFKRYIVTSWSLMLAFFGITSFPNFALFPYLSNLLVSPLRFIEIASLSPMEITRTPIPSFTFFFFILTFYISTETNKPSKNRYLLISMLWTLNIYVYLFNFIAGILFWFPYIIYTCFIKDKGFNFRNIISDILENLMVVLAVISPLLINKLLFFTSIDAEIFQRMELVPRDVGLIVNDWGWIISYVLPSVIVVIVIRLFCADYYELMYKFTPIFILIFVEIFVSNLHLFFWKFFQPGLFSMRIADFFLRYLYFVPVIYFLSCPYKGLFHHTLMNRILGLIHSACGRFVIKLRVFIVTIGILLISLFCMFSNLNYIKHYEQMVAPRMLIINRNFNELVSSVKGKHGVIVSEDIPVNLLVPVLTKEETLLVNGFSNYTSGEEILNRLVLFASIFNWDKQTFLDFMMPSDEYERYNTDNKFILSDQILKKGFGYWLLNHRRRMNPEELERYRENILKVFYSFDISKNIKRYNVRAIHAISSINPALPIELVYTEDKAIIYILEEN